MSQTPVASNDDSLLAALDHNEFDVAGLADLCLDPRCMDSCLRQLYQILRSRRSPKRGEKKRLAQVLASMIIVAQTDYASKGHQEYWPFLFKQIRKAADAAGDEYWGDMGESRPYQAQALLGEWFRTALDVFGYSIPEEGHKYVGPIVFHAGMPYASLPRVLAVIAAACDQFGSQAISLPADIRSGLVTNHLLHRNVERLLASSSQGAAQLWACLARVVWAWKTQGDCSDELQQLPLTLEPEEVRAALPRASQSLRAIRTALPQLRYDADTGEIRLTFPADVSSDWRVTTGKSPIDLAWSRTHLGQSAEFLGPLPGQICVAPTAADAPIDRTFAPYPSHWPGYWFHGHNGNLEDGQTIDASGLAAGRWYVVFEGTPTRFSEGVRGQSQLKWSWFRGNEHWTAWEVDVPVRTTTRTQLEWYVGENCFHVPLARRPGPRVEFVGQPVAQASTPDGHQLEVFSAAPEIVLRRESPISLQLLRETADTVTVIERMQVMPETPIRLPAIAPGVYQLRELRGVGRTVLRFAILPKLRIDGPSVDPHRRYASVTITADAETGRIERHVAKDVARGPAAWCIKASTVQPFLQARWRWTSEDTPGLIFRWPVEALRWRVVRAGEECADWTREPIFISPQVVARHDAQLEIHLPVGSELAINGQIYAGKLQHGPTGNTILLSLMAFGEWVKLEYEGQRYAAVLQSERPLLDTCEAKEDGESLYVSWSACDLPPAMSAVAWDPSKLLDVPTAYSLSHDELASGEWRTASASLPGNQWTAISLAHSAGGFFQRVLRFAGHRSPGIEPISILLDRSTGKLTVYDAKPGGWSKFLHHLTLMRWYQKEGWEHDLDRWVAELDRRKDLDFESAFAMVHDVQHLVSDETTSVYDRRWAELILQVVIRLLRRRVREHPTPALIHDDATGRLDALLNMGVPVGQLYPFAWIANCETLPEGCPYPVQYICDLWLLGTSRKGLESQLSTIGASVPDDFDAMQRNAAARVLRFHRDYGLPSLAFFLPLAGPTATVESTTASHHHAFALPPLPRSFASATDFCEFLGLLDKAIDCQPTCDDQFFDDRQRFDGSTLAPGRARKSISRSRASYSLYWSADEYCWAIETPHCPEPTCCYAEDQPLVVAPLRPADLANSPIRDTLNTWALEERITAEDEVTFAGLHKYRGILTGDTVSGPLHEELFTPPKTATKELLGCPVTFETQAGLSSLATIAWQLAWLERATAWEGPGHVFKGDTENADERLEFLRVLAQAIAKWPTLMRRAIALAELVYWTLFRGGLGLAAHFQCELKEDQFSLQRKPAETMSALRNQAAANAKWSGSRTEGISGVIVGYNAGAGQILLQHRRSPSLKATVRDYVDHGNPERHWFTNFRWNTLSAEVRDHLTDKFTRLRQANEPRTKTLADIMCGLRVTCDLDSDSNGRAIEVKVNFSESPIPIPKHRRRQS